jgi:uncharacterized protein
MRVYFDSSALAKRYVKEQGSEEVLAWCERAGELAISIVAVPEILSALRRLVRERHLAEPGYQSIKRDFMEDISDALVCDTTPEVISRALRVIEAHPLRALDAIHVASATACSSDYFVSADLRQCAAARQSGLEVISLA